MSHCINICVAIFGVFFFTAPCRAAEDKPMTLSPITLHAQDLPG